MRLLSDTLAVLSDSADLFESDLSSEVPTELSTKWQSLAEVDLTIFVGLTGVGKTTTLDAVSALGHTFTLLPNRRTLTDELLIAALQLADGDPVVTVRDREIRFGYTRRYRERYAGGMAHALAQLSIKADSIQDGSPYLFDGLRGVNEVTHAARLLPRARFIVLTAPDFVRVQRLMNRNDQFDQIAASNTHVQSADLLGEAASLFTVSEQEQLYKLVQNSYVDIAELQSKLKIVRTERQNYDSVASVNALLAIAAERTLVVDTATHSPQQVAEQIVAFLG